MEIWQGEAIRRNKVDLLKFTRCNEILLAILVANNILTPEEKDLIDSKATQSEKADKLYEILPSRTGAYNVLLNASKETNQSGLAKLLVDAERDHNFSLALEHCINEDFCYQNINPLLLTANLNFESVRRAIASYVNISVFKLVFEVRRERKPWLLRGPINETLLHVSVAYGYPNMIEYLISLNVDVNSVDGFGRTPLHYIGKCATNIIATTKVFVSQGPNLHQVDKDGMTVATTIASHGTVNQFHYHHWAKYMIQNLYTDLFANETNANCTEVNQRYKDETIPLHHLLEFLDLEKETIDLILKSTEMDINFADNLGRTPLHMALMHGRSLKTIKVLIELGADYKMKDGKNEGAFNFAVRGSNTEVISFLASLNLDINEVDDHCETPLHKVRFTKSRDYFGMTKFLLDIGANLFAKDKNENNIAHLFALTESISSDEFQVWAKDMINIGHGQIFAVRARFRNTPLQTALRRIDPDKNTIKMMLESSEEDINKPDDNGDTLLLLAFRFGRRLETIKSLISLGANTNTKNKDGSGALHCAVVGGNKEVIQYLMSQGLNINERNNDECTPLHFVSQTKSKNYVELTKLLLENGADLYSKDTKGNTLAHEMARWKDLSCDDFKIWVTAMIENGHAHLFTIREKRDGRTPLHFWMERHGLDSETIKLIVESAKLDINQADNYRNTILHLALRSGRSLNTIKKLVELGADWKMKGFMDCKVLHFAVWGSNKEAFLYFKSLGADVNAKGGLGWTPLHYVRWTINADYLGMTKFLLENGADLNVKDVFGRTLDQYMSSCDWISAEEYGVWKEGMIKLGHKSLFQK